MLETAGKDIIASLTFNALLFLPFPDIISSIYVSGFSSQPYRVSEGIESELREAFLHCA